MIEVGLEHAASPARKRVKYRSILKRIVAVFDLWFTGYFGLAAGEAGHDGRAGLL
jgi:hypothetical protein